MTTRPRVSAVMTTCDGARFVEEQLASIVAQSWRPDEIVIVDDASTDDTPAILARFAATCPIPVRILRSEVRRGQAAGFAAGAEAASGDFIAAVDHDDRWMPRRLETVMPAFGPGTLLVFGDLELIDEAGLPLGSTQWRRLGFGPRERRRFARDPLAVLLRYNVVTAPSMVVRRDLLDGALPVPDGWIVDEWLAIVAAVRGGIALVPQPTVAYRQHRDQVLGAAPGGWRARLATARLRVDAAYHERQAGRSDRVADRLGRLGFPEAAAAFSGRAGHYRRRAAMPGSRVRRVAPIAAELIARRYHRFDHGWAGAAWDLIRSR